MFFMFDYFAINSVMSQSLWSQYDRHFVGITRYNALTKTANIYSVIKIKLKPLV